MDSIVIIEKREAGQAARSLGTSDFGYPLDGK